MRRFTSTLICGFITPLPVRESTVGNKYRHTYGEDYREVQEKLVELSSTLHEETLERHIGRLGKRSKERE
jgi:hypothetical protein